MIYILLNKPHFHCFVVFFLCVFVIIVFTVNKMSVMQGKYTIYSKFFWLGAKFCMGWVVVAKCEGGGSLLSDGSQCCYSLSACLWVCDDVIVSYFAPGWCRNEILCNLRRTVDVHVVISIPYFWRNLASWTYLFQNIHTVYRVFSVSVHIIMQLTLVNLYIPKVRWNLKTQNWSIDYIGNLFLIKNAFVNTWIFPTATDATGVHGSA